MGENGTTGLQVVVSPWKLYLQAWLQKLGSTIISAKVLVTLMALYVDTWLATNHHIIQEVVEEVVVDVRQPYITGEQWAGVATAVVVAFIGARVIVPVIEAVGNAVVRAKNGK